MLLELKFQCTNKLVTGTQIRLSDLLKLTYTDANLAANQSGSFEISITGKTLTKDYSLTTRAILVKEEQVIELEKFNGMIIRRACVDAYTNSITFPASNSDLIIHYAGLTSTEKTGLEEYYTDTLISINRPLAEGESFTLNALGTNIAITSLTPCLSQVRLTSLLNIALDDSQLAGTKTGDDTIFASNTTLNDIVNVYIQPVLVKADGTIVHLERTNGLSVVPIGSDVITPSCLAEYTGSIQNSGSSGLCGAGSVEFSHYRNLSETSKAILKDFYTDVLTTVTLNRPLVAGEEVVVQAYGKEVTIGSDKITEADGTKIQLSKLLDQTLGEDQKAVNQIDVFCINVVDKSLVNPITITAVPMLVKDSIAP